MLLLYDAEFGGGGGEPRGCSARPRPVQVVTTAHAVDVERLASCVEPRVQFRFEFDWVELTQHGAAARDLGMLRIPNAFDLNTQILERARDSPKLLRSRRRRGLAPSRTQHCIVDACVQHAA